MDDKLGVILNVDYDSASAIVNFNKLIQQLNQLGNINLRVNVAGMESAASNVQRQMTDLTQSTSTLTNNYDSLGRSFVRTFGKMYLFYKSIKILGDGIRSVTNLDSAMLELEKVTDETEASYARFEDTAFRLSNTLGRTGTEVVSATADFARMGYQIRESMKLAEDALMLSNVSEGMTIDATTNALIATLKGFNLEAAQSRKIIDSLNEVSNNYAVSIAGLSEGIRRVSGTMAQSGTDLDRTIGLLTGGIEVIQNTEKVSSGLITISQRLRGIDEEGENIVDLVPKLQQAFNTVGAGNITDDQGQLLDTYTILEKLAKVYPTLTQNQKAYIGELVSGIRQAPVLNAIMMNFENVQKSVQTSINSVGSAVRENEKYLNSINGRMQIFKSNVENMWRNAIESETVKTVIDFGTSIIQLIDKFGLLNSVLVITMGYLSIAGKVTLPMLITGFQTLGLSIKSGLVAIGQFGASLLGLNGMAVTSTAVFTGLKAVLSTFAPFLIITGIILIGKGLANLIDRLVETKKEVRETIATIDEEIDATKRNIESLNNLGKEYETLSKKTSLSTEEQERFVEVQNQIAGISKETVAYYDDMGNAVLKSSEEIEHLNDELREYVKLKNEEKAENISKLIGDTKGTGFKTYLEYKQRIEELTNELNTKSDREINRLHSGLPFADDKTLDSMQWPEVLRDELKAYKEELVKLGAEMVEYSNEQKDNIKQLLSTEEIYNNLSDAQKRHISVLIDEMDLRDKSKSDLFSVIDCLKEYSKGINTTDDEQLNFLNTLANSNKLFKGSVKNIIDCIKSQNDLAKTFNATSEAVGLEDMSLEQLMKQLNLLELSEDYAVKSHQEFIKENELLLNALEKVREKTYLTADEAYELGKAHSEIIPYIVATADGYTVEESALVNLLNQAKQTKVDTMQCEIDKSKIVLSNILQRIAGYNEEIKSLEDVAKAQKVLANRNPFVNGKTPGNQYDAMLWNDFQQTSKKLKTLEDSMRTIEELKSNIGSTISNIGTPKSVFAKNSTGNSNYEKEKQEFVSKLSDSYSDLSFEIDKTKDAIDRLDRKLGSATDDKDKVKIYNDLIVLYRKEQEQLHKLNEARRKDVDKNIEALRKQGFAIAYNKDLNLLLIKNKEHVNDLSNGVREKYEGIIEDTINLVDANKDASNEWVNLADSIDAANSSIDDINKNLKELQKEIKLTNQEVLTENLERDLEDIKTAEDEMSEMLKKVHEQKIDQYEEERDKFKDLIDSQIEEIDRLEAERDFARDNEDKKKDLEKLQNEINTLILDDSKESINKRTELEERYNDLLKDLQEGVHDHDIENEKKLLREKSNERDSYYNDLIEKERNLLDDSRLLIEAREMLVNESIESIQNAFSNLGMTIDNEVIRALERTKELLSDTTNASFNINNKTTVDDTKDKLVIDMYRNMMIANSMKWENASTVERIRLQEDNLRLAEELRRKVDNISLEIDNGAWFLNGNRFYDLNKKGYGENYYNTNASSFVNPVMDSIRMPIADLLNRNLIGSSNNNSKYSIGNLISINGNVDEKVLPELRGIADNIVSNLVDGTNMSGSYSPKMA